MMSLAHLPILPVMLPLIAGIVLLVLRNRGLAVQRGVLIGADDVALDVRLQPSLAVADIEERRLAHVSLRRDPPRDGRRGRVAIAAGRFPRLEGRERVRRRVRPLRPRRIRIDAARANARELLAPKLNQFLFARHGGSIEVGSGKREAEGKVGGEKWEVRGENLEPRT